MQHSALRHELLVLQEAQHQLQREGVIYQGPAHTRLCFKMVCYLAIQSMQAHDAALARQHRELALHTKAHAGIPRVEPAAPVGCVHSGKVSLHLRRQSGLRNRDCAISTLFHACHQEPQLA